MYKGPAPFNVGDTIISMSYGANEGTISEVLDKNIAMVTWHLKNPDGSPKEWTGMARMKELKLRSVLLGDNPNYTFRRKKDNTRSIF